MGSIGEPIRWIKTHVNINVGIIYMSTLAVELRLGEASQASAGPEKAETATFVRMTKQTWVGILNMCPSATECTVCTKLLETLFTSHLGTGGGTISFKMTTSAPYQASNGKAVFEGRVKISFSTAESFAEEQNSSNQLKYEEISGSD